MVWLVRSSFSDWNKTFWSDINVELMETECKKYVKVKWACMGVGGCGCMYVVWNCATS